MIGAQKYGCLKSISVADHVSSSLRPSNLRLPFLTRPPGWKPFVGCVPAIDERVEHSDDALVLMLMWLVATR